MLASGFKYLAPKNLPRSRSPTHSLPGTIIGVSSSHRKEMCLILTTSRRSPVILASKIGMPLSGPFKRFWLSLEKCPCESSLKFDRCEVDLYLIYCFWYVLDLLYYDLEYFHILPLLPQMFLHLGRKKHPPVSETSDIIEVQGCLEGLHGRKS